MIRRKFSAILRKVRAGKMSANAALKALEWMPFEDVGFARLDTHRELRKGAPEVVFCQGKTLDQSETIIRRILGSNGRVMATRAPAALNERLKSADRQVFYEPRSRILVLGKAVKKRGGIVGVLCAGTSDIPVAEEAALTAEFLGVRVVRAYDVGVAGLHRILSHGDLLRSADVLVVAAGMEGALPSVVSGLAKGPVIAVPTSVGYGASFGGLAALLAMINSCAPGVTVVNIDNGFGAGYTAALIAGIRRRRKG